MSGSPPATSVVAKQITPTGRGAVACVALRGPREALAQVEFPFSAANRKPMAAQPLGRICFGKWGAGTVEEIVLTRVTEQYWEIHCHGGEAAVGRILTDLESLGVQSSPDSPGHWIDSRWLESHCYETALAARTARSAEIALRQAGGCLRAELETILSLVSERSTDLTEPIRRLDLLLQWSDVGRHLVTPWTVVLAGRPNVGKSSLMNALVGYGRSIVVDRPGTTRDVVTAETAIDGWLLTLADTAGIRNASDVVEAEGVRRAEQQIRTADLVIHVQEATDSPTSELKPDQPEVPGALLVWNKCDRTTRKSLPSQTGVILTSAVTGEGIQTLCKAIVGRLVPHAPGPNDVVPTGQEMIRRLEEVSRCLRDRDVAEASSRLIEMLEL